MSQSSKVITLILGGVRSGKSRYAQALASHYSSVVFIATATPGDEEMHRKIERHRASRPIDWPTIEEPIHLDCAIRRHAPDHAVALVDCLTLYAANLLCQADNEPDPTPSIERFCSSLVDSPSSIILVSNEVGSGVVPEYALGRRYRDFLGEINQQVAAIADNVLFMVAGLPMLLKGKLAA